MNLNPEVSPRAIEALESQILNEWATYQHELGDGQKIYEDNPLYDTICDMLEDKISRFPQIGHTRFIGSRCIVTPKLLVGLDRLETLFEERVKGNMFLGEVVQKILFGPLSDPILGDITTENTTLKLTNIRVLHDREPTPNEFTEEMLLQRETEERNCILLNADETYGYVDTNPNIVKTQILANVEFGDFKEKDQLIDLQTEGTRETTLLSVTLPPFEGKIHHTGSVRLIRDGLIKELALEQLKELTEFKPRNYIVSTFHVDAPFYPYTN